jgi:hypothetical protein
LRRKTSPSSHSGPRGGGTSRPINPGAQTGAPAPPAPPAAAGPVPELVPVPAPVPGPAPELVPVPEPAGAAALTAST